MNEPMHGTPALEWLARGGKKKRVAKPPAEKRVVVDVSGDGNSGSLTVVSLLSALLDKEGVPHDVVFSNPRQEAGFRAARERALEELADFAKRRDRLILCHTQAAYGEKPTT